MGYSDIIFAEKYVVALHSVLVNILLFDWPGYASCNDEAGRWHDSTVCL